MPTTDFPKLSFNRAALQAVVHKQKGATPITADDYHSAWAVWRHACLDSRIKYSMEVSSFSVFPCIVWECKIPEYEMFCAQLSAAECGNGAVGYAVTTGMSSLGEASTFATRLNHAVAHAAEMGTPPSAIPIRASQASDMQPRVDTPFAFLDVVSFTSTQSAP